MKSLFWRSAWHFERAHLATGGLLCIPRNFATLTQHTRVSESRGGPSEPRGWSGNRHAPLASSASACIPPIIYPETLGAIGTSHDKSAVNWCWHFLSALDAIWSRGYLGRGFRILQYRKVGRANGHRAIDSYNYTNFIKTEFLKCISEPITSTELAEVYLKAYVAVFKSRSVSFVVT